MKTLDTTKEPSDRSRSASEWPSGENQPEHSDQADRKLKDGEEINDDFSTETPDQEGLTQITNNRNPQLDGSERIINHGFGKSPTKALALSLLPGLGHIYIGQIFSGLVFLISSLVSGFLVISTCAGPPFLKGLQHLVTSFNLPYNPQFSTTLGANISHPAVLLFAFLYACYLFYVAQDAYLCAARANSPFYQPSRGIRLAPVFGGSYLMHCLVLLVLLGAAFFVAGKKPQEVITQIDLLLEPPPPEEPPAPEPPKPRKTVKPTPKPEEPKPVQKVASKPAPKPVVTPPVVSKEPVPVASVPTQTSPPPVESGPETGKGSGDAAPSGKGDSDAGGGGDGDEADFTAYLAEMEKKIRQSWFPPRGNESKKIVVQFKLDKSGKVSGLRLKTSSGIMLADTAASDAVKNAGPFGSLPKGAPDKVDIVFTFDYTVFNGGKASLRN